MFVDRFYIETRDNLLRSGFDLAASFKYFDKASDLIFDRRLKDTLEFENSETKWIKTLGDLTFLVTSDLAFPVESSTIKNGFFESKNDYYHKQIVNCSGPTLRVGNEVFCFDRKTYHRIDTKAKSYQIEQIFVNTRIDYTNQTLELIFSYNGAFVMMTRTHLFVIDYRLANLENGGQSIAISDGPKDRLYRLTNHLFRPIPTTRLTIQPAEKALFLLILILINLLFTGIIFRIIMHRKRLAENRSKEMMNTFNFIHNTMSLRDNIRKTLNIKSRLGSRISDRSSRTSKTKKSSRSKRSGRSKGRMQFDLMKDLSSDVEKLSDFHSARRDRKKKMRY